MQIKTKAIVFHSFKCNDNRIIVDFHILDCGRLSVAVTVSNSRKTKFRKTLLSQLTFYIELDVRQRAGLKTVIDDSLTV